MSERIEERAFRIAGYFVLILIAGFGAHYALLRFSAYDSAYYFFKIIEKKDFFIPHDRYISYFAQWPAVVAVNLNVPLRFLLPLASLGYSLFFIVHYFIASRFKSKEHLAWLGLLFFCLSWLCGISFTAR